MGRNYIRKTEKGADKRNYTRRDLDLAVEDVKSGRRTVRGSAKLHNIPRTTLIHYLQGTRGKGCVSKNGKGGGGKLQLSEEDEKKLSDNLKVMEKWGFGLSRREVLDVVQAYIKEHNIETRFKDGRPGEEWFIWFCKRNKLSIKKPQAVESARMSQINPYTVYGLYDLLDNTIKELDLLNKPHLIFNCDETSFAHDPSKTKVVGAKGARSIRMTAGCGRENTSVLLCVSASGQKIPPLCVFKGKNVLESWISRNTHDQTGYAASKRGWMDTVTFSKWFMKCFLTSVPEDRPILLIYDGHASHINSEILRKAQENNVHIIKLPPHTTHYLQPLDVAVNKSLKCKWDQELVKWQRQNPRKVIPKSLFVDILNKIYDEMPSSVITNGFKKTGIYDQSIIDVKGSPVNYDAINKTVFKPADLKRYEKRNQNQEDINELTRPENNNIPLNVVENKVQDNAVEIVEEIAAPLDNQHGSKNSFENILLSYINKSNSDERPVKRRRICSAAEIITKNDFLEKLEADELKKKLIAEEKAAKKAAREAKKAAKEITQKIKKKPMSNIISGSSSSDTDSFVAESESSEAEESILGVIENDFVIVLYNDLYFPGKVVERKEETVKVSCMEKYGKYGFNWKWPNNPDELWYDEKDILKIIPPPTPVNKRGLFSVPAMEKYVP